MLLRVIVTHHNIDSGRRIVLDRRINRLPGFTLHSVHDLSERVETMLAFLHVPHARQMELHSLELGYREFRRRFLRELLEFGYRHRIKLLQPVAGSIGCFPPAFSRVLRSVLESAFTLRV